MALEPGVAVPESLPTFRFEIVLRRSDDGYGLQLRKTPDGAQVLLSFEEDRSAGDWNRMAAVLGMGERALCPGDRIVRANGFTEASEIFAAFAAERVTLTVERFAKQFVLTFYRDLAQESSLGLLVEVPKSESGSSLGKLVLKEVEPGLIEQWNRHAMERGEFHLVVRPGMAISEVNGLCEPQLMTGQLAQARLLRMSFRRT